MPDTLVQDVRQNARNNADRANREYVIASRGWFVEWRQTSRPQMQKAFEILLQTSDFSLQVPMGSRICGDLSSSAFGSASDILDNFADPAEAWVSLDTGVLRAVSSGVASAISSSRVSSLLPGRLLVNSAEPQPFNQWNALPSRERDCFPLPHFPFLEKGRSANPVEFLTELLYSFSSKVILSEFGRCQARRLPERFNLNLD